MILSNIWVINLDKSKNRLNKIEKNMGLLNLPFNRFSAVYGKELDDITIENNVTTLCKQILCNYSIIGCAMSHINLWKQLANSNSEAYLILEDDAILTDSSVNIIKKIENKIDEYSIDIVNLYCNDLGNIFSENIFTIDKYNFKKSVFPLLFTAYIITKKGAKKILEKINKISYHIDFEIARINLFDNLNYYASEIPLVLNNNDDTTIGKKSDSLIINICDKCGLNYLTWLLSVNIFTINLYWEINILLILLILLLLLNIYRFNIQLLMWFLILELFLYNIVFVIPV